MRDYADIIPIFEKRWADQPDSYYFLPLANAYRAVGQPDRAIEVLRKGLDRHPDYHGARAALAAAYLDAELHDEAQAEAESVLAAHPENLLTRRLLVECHREAGRVEEALAEMKRLLELAPADERLQGALRAMEGYLAEEASEVLAEAEETVEAAGFLEDEDLVPIEEFAEVVEEAEEEPAEAAVEEEEPEAEALVEEEPEAEEPAEVVFEFEEERQEAPIEAAAEEATPEEEVFEEELPEEELPEEELVEEEPLEEPAPVSATASEDDEPETMEKFLVEDEESVSEPPKLEAPEVEAEEEAPPKGFAEFLARVEMPEEEPRDKLQEEPEDNEKPKGETLEAAGLPSERVPETVFDDETILDGSVGVAEEEEPPAEEVKYAQGEEVVFADDAPDELSSEGRTEPRATATLGELYAAQGHLADAVEVFRQLIKEYPYNERYRTRLEEIEDELAASAFIEPEARPPSRPSGPPEPREEDLEELVDDSAAVEEIHGLFPSEPAPDEEEEEEPSAHVIDSLKGWLDNLKRRSGSEPPAVDIR